MAARCMSSVCDLELTRMYAAARTWGVVRSWVSASGGLVKVPATQQQLVVTLLQGAVREQWLP
jgi:hypothetical protein